MLNNLPSRLMTLYNRNEHLRQFITYFFVGGFSALSDIIFLFILVEVFNVYYLFAAVISFITVSTVAFFLHKRFTFRYDGGRNKLRYALFIMTATTGLFWNVALLFLFVEVFNIYYIAAAVITKFIVFAWNFLVNKFVTFRKLKS